MPLFTAHGRQLSYHIEGEGFPLLLIPDAGGTIQEWRPTLPLLAELCRVIVYEYDQQPPAVSDPTPSEAFVDDLVALLNALAITRTYGAGYAAGGDVALRLARRAPSRLAGLLLINPGNEVRRQALANLSMPTLVVEGQAASACREETNTLAARLPHCTSTIIRGASLAPPGASPLPLGQALLAFLMQCERQRTLVRGASFLL
jgi:pimeloyl-ACP methyl ester carboxylesterase